MQPSAVTWGYHTLCLPEICFVNCGGVSEPKESTVLTRTIVVQKHQVFDVVGIVSTDFSLTHSPDELIL